MYLSLYSYTRKKLLFYVYKQNLINLKSYKYEIRYTNIIIPTVNTTKCNNYFVQPGLGLLQNMLSTLWSGSTYFTFKKNIKLWLQRQGYYK